VRFRSVTGPDYDANNKPFWPTWAAGALFRGPRCIHIKGVCFHLTPRQVPVRFRSEAGLTGESCKIMRD
jgi:hypothetical protein